MENFNDEYFIMKTDGANNHPMLAWGKTKIAPFIKAEPVNADDYELPLQIPFSEPYPNEYEMVDLHMLNSLFGASEQLKNLFETMNVHGVQFVPVEITSNKNDVIKGYHVLHIWNKLTAIDKSNYVGSEPNRFGNILSLQQFALDSGVLNTISLEERLIFGLKENSTIYLVHQILKDAIEKAGLKGMCFWKVSEWNDNTMFQ